MSKFDSKGREIPVTGVKKAVPVRVRRMLSDYDHIRNAIHQVSMEASRQGFESAEEANDFDIDDGFDFDTPMDHPTPHELVFDEQFGEIPREMKAEVDKSRRQFDAHAKKSRFSRFWKKKEAAPPTEDPKD